VLGIIARKMGKRARFLCTQLCQAYGPPGTVLRLESASAHTQRATSVHRKSSRSIIRSWRHPLAVRRLDLGHDVMLDGATCHCIAQALPNLLELSCGRIDPSLDAPSISPHTALTSLRAIMVTSSMHAIAAFAPSLRLLHYSHSTASGNMWEALSPLRCLQHLQVPVRIAQLTPPDSFCAAMQALTGLTHLGLHHHMVQDGGPSVMPLGAMECFTKALDCLPLLASLKLRGLHWLGPSLGAALQGLSLSQMHLEELRVPASALGPPPPDLAGRVPKTHALPLLQHLTLCGNGVLTECWRVGGRANEWLRSLELTQVDVSQLGAVRDMLTGLSAVTSLGLQVAEVLPRWAYGRQGTVHPGLELAVALPLLTRLQHLEISGDLHGYLPCLAGLPALTSLDLSFSQYGVQQRADLRVVSALSSLRKLSLHAGIVQHAQRAQLLRMVWSIPLLEQVALHCGRWTDGEVAVLVPPPDALQRVVLGTPASAAAACAALDAVNVLRGYGVDVVVEQQ
jgi:hypothetical protein